MSLVVSILFVLGLFAVLGLLAWATVMHALTSPRGAVSRTLLVSPAGFPA
jgi:hypothetical protein